MGTGTTLSETNTVSKEELQLFRVTGLVRCTKLASSTALLCRIQEPWQGWRQIHVAPADP